MTIIDSQTVVVYDFVELKSVLEGNNTYDYVYFGANITLTGGINLNPSRANLTIDGTYDNIRYTYTDYNSAANTQTIYLLRTPSNMNITVQNIDVIGRNYYGVICVFDTSSFSNVVVNYINIDYTGPQMAFNPYCSLNITDCNINIIASSASPANEVAETRNVTLSGNVNIHSVTTSTSIFWFRNVVGGVYPFLKVAPNANVTITSENRYLYYVSSATYINMEFGSNSNTNISAATGLNYDDSHRTNNVLINNDAILTITQLQQFGATSTWCINGDFKMNNNSSLKMISDYSGSTSNYSIRFMATTATFNLNNPKSVVIYNRPAFAIHSNYTIPFILNISQYNRWTTLTPYSSAGDIYDIPTYSWYKIENTSNLTISGNITTSTTTILSNNLTTTEIPLLPPLSNFLLNNTKVLSMGRPSLTINPITDLSTEITGATVPNADVRISYDSVVDYVQADVNGNYEYQYPIPLPIGTEISFVANLANSFLYRFRAVEIIFPGDISVISATEKVYFSTTPYKYNPTLGKRITPLEVVVEDSRIYPSPWKLFAYVNQELTNERLDVLTDGLVYIDDLGNMTVLSNAPVLVYEDAGLVSGTTNISWPDEEGILLQLNIVPIVANTIYSTDINWHLEII